MYIYTCVYIYIYDMHIPMYIYIYMHINQPHLDYPNQNEILSGYHMSPKSIPSLKKKLCGFSQFAVYILAFFGSSPPHIKPQQDVGPWKVCFQIHMASWRCDFSKKHITLGPKKLILALDSKQKPNKSWQRALDRCALGRQSPITI